MCNDMTIYKCKMCGGNLQIEKGTTTCRCIYCDTLQTIAAVDDNKKTELFNRANTLRMNREFDRAAGVYESIIKDCPEEAEAYWGMVLCKYGILYVDDPGTGKKIPTCNRTSYVSIFDDADYKLTEKFSDPSALSVYRQEAQKIDDIQKGILNIVRLEAPYDIFISYKEKDHGERTEDSVLGQEIYEELTARGYRVFFSMISLEGKLGTEYEPYIYAALNSSKVMLALGTTPEHYNAVWVKNEWSRYLTLMEKDRNKTLIAVFKGMTPSDLPVELQGIQGQDMSKIGAMQDLLRGIDKILGKDRMHLNLQDEDKYVNTGYVNIQSLLQRGKIALEDRDWNKAESFYEQVLNNDAENGDAYIGKMLISFKVSSFDELFNLIGKDDLQTLEQYETKHACESDIEHINRSVKENTVPGYVNEDTLLKLYEFNDSYRSRAAAARRHRNNMLSKYDDNRYIRRAVQYATGDAKAELQNRMKAWKDSLDKAVKIAEEEDQNKVKQIRAAYEQHMKKADQEAALMRERANAIVKRNAEKQRRSNRNFLITIAVTVLASIILVKYIMPNKQYKEAVSHLEKGNYDTAYDIFSSLEGFKNSREMMSETRYQEAQSLMNNGDYYTAYHILAEQESYKDSKDLLDSMQAGYTNGLPQLAYASDIGDHVYFGTYEQDNDSSNGKERIKWTIAEKTGSGALLVCEYGLDCKPFNTEQTDVSWETCSLRTWLNNEFMYSAFTEEEISLISETQVYTVSNPEYGTWSGNETTDMVFILSIQETENYRLAECELTEYAKAQGADSKVWLRTAGQDPGHASDDVDWGNIITEGSEVSSMDHGVRPALWISY